mgnify:CR=1 FL=1
MKAPLDPDFQPIQRQPGPHPLVIGLEREDGRVSRYETTVAPDALRYVERLVKFLLWARGGWRLYLSGPRALCERVRVPDFDRELMGRVYERQFEIIVTDTVPPARESSAAIGGHQNGCRLGFDLGASDFKIAAVKDGEVLYSDEFPWNPKDQPDPQYHYEKLTAGLKKAAAHLPRVDAIGGSTAGVVVNNKIMVASLFRSVPAEKFADAKNIFLRLRDEWRVPLEVANDGDVTALAMGLPAVLGVAMGSSEAAGYIDRQGHMTGWLNELAFAPVDDNPAAPADEWSGDRGVGALYFSQQAVNKLLPAAGITPTAAGLPERLKEVQALMAKGDARAAKIYETIGVYLGHAIPLYREFYDFDHLLVLGRVMTGKGGDIILSTAREVLGLSPIQIHVPDEKSKRVGQAVAAASLPAL